MPCIFMTISETLMTARRIRAMPISFRVHLSVSIAASAGAARLIPNIDGKVPMPKASITVAPEIEEPAADAVRRTL